MNLEASFVGAVLDQFQPDIMRHRSGPIGGRTGEGYFKFAWQVLKFRVHGRPLPQQFTPGSRIFHLGGVDTRQMITGNIPDTTTAGLNGVHLHRGQLFQNIGNLLKS